MRISRSSKPRIVITMGDPSGIGPEVTLKALASPEVKGLANFLVIGETSGPRGIKSARASLEYIDKALELAMAGEADAIVTAPVSKAAIKKAGFPDFQGHTEYFAKRTGTNKFVMMFVGEHLKVALVTRHVSLRRIPVILNSAMIYDTITLTNKYLKEYFQIRSPRIAVSGLNPHAGEGGAFGNEEAKVILPAIKKASKVIKNIYGPLPADVAFHEALKNKYDVVIAMYHDQGLAPFKTLYFNSGVNLTLGLPFIRTSPDHGTAFDLAGKGVADPTSMIEAIRLACRLAKKCSHRIS
jgi:4-hydroxythreonine-4-phosphate dehydrogenase